MHTLFRLFAVAALFSSSLVLTAQPRRLGVVEVPVDKETIAIRVSSNVPDLNALAQIAFRAHGRYRVVGSDQQYDLRFTSLGGNSVRVDILRGRETAPAFSETVTGTSPRNALLRAADVAVAKTNGLNLRGFFTARLAFVGESSGKSEVYTCDLFGTDLKRITNDRAHVLSPRWSPDGSRILYTSFLRNFPDIYEINLNTFQRTVFADYRGTNSGARFSPDGRQVAMVLTTGAGTPEIWVRNAAGGTPVRKTHLDSAKSSPCWSPDGSQIVFAMEPGPQLWVMSAAGGSPRRLATGYSYSAEPDWSRTDRNKIACTVRSGGYQIAVYDLSSGKTEVVSKAPFDGIEPSWLADGRHLVYTARDRRTSVLCILDTVTGKSTPISERLPVSAAAQASVLAGQ
jgi:TolB protein